jgi:hypothetical protein
MPNVKDRLAGFQMNVAVFTFRGCTPESLLDLMLVHLEADTGESAAADAVARGGRFAGCFAVKGGDASVQTEPGFEAAMVYAGAAFSEMLGPLLKQHQLEQSVDRP